MHKGLFKCVYMSPSSAGAAWAWVCCDAPARLVTMQYKAISFREGTTGWLATAYPARDQKMVNGILGCQLQHSSSSTFVNVMSNRCCLFS